MSAKTRRINHLKPGLRCSSVAIFMLATLLQSSTVSVMAEDIRLVGGNVLSVEILERRDDLLIVRHEALGRLEIAREKIDSISDVGEVAGEETSASTRLAVVQDEKADTPKKEWKSHFVVGFTGSFGNTDTQDVTGSLVSTRTREREVLKLDMAYYLGMTDGDRTDNRLTAGARQDWLVPDSRWLYFVQGRYDFDEFQSWDYRINGHGGFGYELIKKENFTLIGRVGLGAKKEFNSEDDDVAPEALVGITLNWAISEKQSFDLESTIFPGLDDTGEYRMLNTARWAMKVDEQSNISLVASLFHEYESAVDPGIDKNDLKVTVGLQFDF